MIPIKCPNCNRRGNVPPDRLGARLTCKACHVVFHMDAGGRMVLGEPGGPAPKKGVKSRSAASAADIDLAQTWRDVPKPAKFGVPAVCLVLAGWMMMPSLSSELAYEGQAEVVGQALINGNRAKVVAAATTPTAEAAGKWYDLAYAAITEKGLGSAANNTVRAALLSGNPERDSSLSVSVVVLSDAVATNFNMQMIKDGSSWKFDGVTTLNETERTTAVIKLAKKK